MGGEQSCLLHNMGVLDELRMSSTPPSLPTESGEFELTDKLDLTKILKHLKSSARQIAGWGLLGFVLAALLALLTARYSPSVTTTRVVFSFKGFDRGEYPDGSKFQPDDLRAPQIISEALKNRGIDDSGPMQSAIRGAINVEGLVPPNIVKERDRLRAAGQTPPQYIPDEYLVSLSLPRNHSLGPSQRAALLSEIVRVYRETFQKTYTQPPVSFGTVFETLSEADFPEYEIVLNAELDRIRGYLSEQMETAKTFRSVTTNLTYADLLEQVNVFAQIQLNEVLGSIHQYGLSRNRATAMLKMDYYLRQLEERDRRANEEEAVVTSLLTQAQTRTQNYVLGYKSSNMVARPEGGVVDQGLIDSLLANDAYNFLVRRSLDAGLKVKAIEAEKLRLSNLRDNMQKFTTSNTADQSAIIEQVRASIADLARVYGKLVENIRKTHADYSQQQFGNAVRLSDQVRTAGYIKAVAITAAVGAVFGCAFGLALSLLISRPNNS